LLPILLLTRAFSSARRMSRCFGDIERMSPRSVQFIPALWAPFQGLWEGSLWSGISRCGFRHHLGLSQASFSGCTSPLVYVLPTTHTCFRLKFSLSHEGGAEAAINVR